MIALLIHVTALVVVLVVIAAVAIVDTERNLRRPSRKHVYKTQHQAAGHDHVRRTLRAMDEHQTRGPRR